MHRIIPLAGGMQYSRRNAVAMHWTSANLLPLPVGLMADRFRGYSSSAGSSAVLRQYSRPDKSTLPNALIVRWYCFARGSGLFSHPRTPSAWSNDSQGHATFAGAPLSTPAAAVFGVPFGKWHCLSAISCAATCTYGAGNISGVLALRPALSSILKDPLALPG
jgi:hypothetical protein